VEEEGEDAAINFHHGEDASVVVVNAIANAVCGPGALDGETVVAHDVQSSLAAAAVV